MTQINYRANLTAAELPMLTDFQGRSIIVPGPDQNFSRQLSSPRNKDKDVGIPQAYYAENIIPTDAGFTTIGYLQVAYPPSDGQQGFQNIFLIRDPVENICYLGTCADGSNYVLLSANTAWVKINTILPGLGGITSAHVNGETYIYFGLIGCYKYVFSTGLLTAVTLTALTPDNILGITASSSGFMLAWTKTDLLISSSVDPTDFTPSLATGAGGGPVQATRGPITCVVPHFIGVMCYTKKNIVAGYYTGNAAYPFNWKELVDSGGVANTDLVAFDANSNDQFAYTTDGLQAVNGNNAQVIFPQITDFLAGSTYESFSLVTNTFTQTVLAVNMKKAIQQVNSRYVLLSYGINSLTDIIYSDLALARFGKLKIPHVKCFEYSLINSDVIETPRRSIGILQADGTIKVVVMSYDTTGSNGVLVLGKYQYQRNNYLKLLDISLENIKSTANFSCQVLSSTDGKNTLPVITSLLYNSGSFRKYGCNTSGINHSLILSGAFHISSLELNFVDAGKVR